MHLSELLRTVQNPRCSSAEVQQWVPHCSLEALNSRCAPHGALGQFALCAPPLWLACYLSDHATVRELLRSGRCDTNPVACGCSGGGHAMDCEHNGQSVVHVAVRRGASDAIRLLVNAGVDLSAPCCFAVDEVDEPEWDEKRAQFNAGLKGLTALQLAALRSDDALCSLLLSYGASASGLRAMPEGAAVPAALAPKLTPLIGDDGEPLECPICYDALIRLTSAWTPCCTRPFHEHCLRGLRACPLCRASLQTGERGGEPRGDAELAAAVASTVEGTRWADVEAVRRVGGGGAPARRPHNSLQSTANHERALELAFSGPQWRPDQPQTSGMGSFNTTMGSNYGHFWQTQY